MPKLRQESFGAGDMTWLDSTHGIRDGRTVVIDISTFDRATHYPDGYIPSGFPLAVVAGVAVPYDPTVGTTVGAGVLAGHLLTDQRVIGTDDFGAPLLDHGRVNAAKVAAILTNFAKPIAAKNATTIVYV